MTALSVSKTEVSALPFPQISAVGSIEAYISKVNQVPVLSADEERALAERWYQAEDLEAARQLVVAHLRFVVQIARGYQGYGLALPDLIQEGNIGLMKAVKRFDPSVGVRLVSFAVHWIKSEIHDFVIRNWRIVRIATTKAQRKLFFNLRKAKKRLGWFNDAEVNQVAHDLNVTPREVREMEMRLQAQDDTLNIDPAENDSEQFHPSPIHYLTAEDSDPAEQLEQWQESQVREKNVAAAWEILTERERDIIQCRWLAEEKETLQDLAVRFGISAERVRQVEQKALAKLQNLLPPSSALI